MKAKTFLGTLRPKGPIADVAYPRQVHGGDFVRQIRELAGRPGPPLASSGGGGGGSMRATCTPPPEGAVS